MKDKNSKRGGLECVWGYRIFIIGHDFEMVLEGYLKIRADPANGNQYFFLKYTSSSAISTQNIMDEENVEELANSIKSQER